MAHSQLPSYSIGKENALLTVLVMQVFCPAFRLLNLLKRIMTNVLGYFKLLMEAVISLVCIGGSTLLVKTRSRMMQQPGTDVLISGSMGVHRLYYRLQQLWYHNRHCQLIHWRIVCDLTFERRLRPAQGIENHLHVL